MPAFLMRTSSLRGGFFLRGATVSTNKSKYLSDLFLSWEAGVAMPAPPATLYLALLLATPTKNDGTGLVEVSGTSYARIPITAATWAAITTNADNVTEQSSTNAICVFPTPGSNWGTIAGVAVYDAVSGGNLYRYGTLAGGNLTVNQGYIVSISSGSLTRTEA